jgi:hypothetical protein
LREEVGADLFRVRLEHFDIIRHPNATNKGGYAPQHA